MILPEPRCFAAVSDIHGNRWALEAVLDDIGRSGIKHVVNLGDSLYGPLDPAGTADILLSLGWPTVRGNEDRIVEDSGDPSSTLIFVRNQLDGKHRAWLAGLPQTAVPYEGVYLCHGTPDRDDEYLLSDVTVAGAIKRSPASVFDLLQAVAEPLVLCGHDHVPGQLAVDGGRLVVNPGSVGLQAYTDDTPFPHVMETGSPEARYAILSRDGRGWQVESIAVDYDWKSAASAATKNNCDDWALWLRTGTARANGGVE